MRGRFLLAAAVMAAIAALATAPAQAHGDLVALPAAYAPGTIVVKTSERHLYLVVGPGQAIRYPVGVGRAGQQWSGTSVIDAYTKFDMPRMYAILIVLFVLAIGANTLVARLGGLDDIKQK